MEHGARALVVDHIFRVGDLDVLSVTHRTVGVRRRHTVEADSTEEGQQVVVRGECTDRVLHGSIRLSQECSFGLRPERGYVMQGVSPRRRLRFRRENDLS